jgi:hypothetical protein
MGLLLTRQKFVPAAAVTLPPFDVPAFLHSVGGMEAAAENRRGDTVAFSNGIIILTVLAIALVVIFDGNILRLIPLYAVGVFLSLCGDD